MSPATRAPVRASGGGAGPRRGRLRPGAVLPVVAVLAAGAVLATGALPVADAADLAGQTWSVLVFLLAAAVLAELAGVAGVFEVAAVVAARRGGGRTWVLWLLVVALATASTVLLSLDTTAVLLTPVVLVVARRTGAPALALAMTCAWLANTASLLLPVSNLTNLLALDVLDGGPAGGSVLAFAALMWRPALAAVLATAAVLAVLHRRELSGRYAVPGPAVVQDRVLLRAGALVVVAVLPALAVGLPPWAVVGAAALVLAAVVAVRRRSALRWSLLPLPLAVSVAGLFVVVAALGRHGLTPLLGAVAGTGDGPWALLRLAGTAALAANAVDNLPAYLALQPLLSAQDPLRVAAVLVGVGAGPLLTPWGSLAVLLWARVCRAQGLVVDWWGFAARGLLLVPVVVVAAVLALAL